MTEIGDASQERTEGVDRRMGLLEVLPGDVDDVGQEFAVLACFTHEPENQEFSKTQGPQALKVRWQLPGCLF